MAPLRAAGPDAYATLGVARGASDAQIRQAYRRLALQRHPDKARAVSRERATKEFQDIQAAYEAVSPENRGRYDLGAGGAALGKTELIAACEARDVDRVRRLVEESADVNAQDSTGRTALMYASGAACLGAMRELIRRAADVEAKNCAGHSCVHFAVGAGIKVDGPEKVQQALDHLEAVRLLLDEGAPVNASTGYGLTPLMLAATSGRINMVELLLSRGAEPNAATDIGLSALVMAADRGHAEVAGRLLRAAASPNSRYGAGKTALMSASALAHTGVVRALLAGGADVGAVSADGHTALIYAAERGLKDGLVCPVEGPSVQKPEAAAVCEMLLEAAADPGAAGPGGRTALHVACAGGGPALVRRLLAAGARADAEDHEGRTPLRIAHELGCEEVIACFLRAGENTAAMAAAAFDVGAVEAPPDAGHRRSSCATCDQRASASGSTSLREEEGCCSAAVMQFFRACRRALDERFVPRTGT